MMNVTEIYSIISRFLNRIGGKITSHVDTLHQLRGLRTALDCRTFTTYLPVVRSAVLTNQQGGVSSNLRTSATQAW